MRVVYFIFVLSLLALTEARPKNQQKLTIYEIRERGDGKSPEVKKVKVPSEVLIKTLAGVQNKNQEEEDEEIYDDGGELDLQKLLATLLDNKEKPKEIKLSKKKQKQLNLIMTLKTLVKRLEKEYELEGLLDNDELRNEDDNDDDYDMGYYLVPQSKSQKSNSDKLNLIPLQLAALRSGPQERSDDRNEDREFGDDRTMPPPHDTKYDDDY